MIDINIIDKILSQVVNNQQIITMEFSLNELLALDKVAWVISHELYNIREKTENDGKEMDIEQSLFIDSLISASNKLNDAELC